MMEKWYAKFIEEINHSIYAYHNEMINEEITKIVITGAKMLSYQPEQRFVKGCGWLARRYCISD